MTTLRELQARMAALALSPGPIDGLLGPKTLGAIERALKRLEDAGKDASIPPVSENSMQTSDIINSQPIAARSINEIVIHCTATPEGREVSVDTIRAWHKARGWRDTGYHYVVHLDGTVEAGRPEAQTGAHVAGHNTGTLGVVYVGGTTEDINVPKDTRTPEQKAALMDVCRALISKYPRIKRISGHNHFAAKACPSFEVKSDPLGKLI